MAIAWTFALIGSRVAEMLVRSDVTTQINEFIDIAEQEIAREVFPYGFEMTGLGSVVTNVGTIAQPTGYRASNSLRMVVGTLRVQLEKRPLEFVLDYWQNLALTGTPKYYAQNGTNVVVVPTPSGTYNYEWVYQARLTPLDSGNTTNWITGTAPDLLIYKTLVVASRYLRDDARVQNRAPAWEAQYAAISKAMMEQHMRDNTDRYQTKR